MPLVRSSLATFMGIHISITCPRRAQEPVPQIPIVDAIVVQPVDTDPHSLQLGLRTAAVWSRWIKFVHFATKLLTQRVVGRHWWELGRPFRARMEQSPEAARHYGRVGSSLKKHRKSTIEQADIW